MPGQNKQEERSLQEVSSLAAGEGGDMLDNLLERFRNLVRTVPEEMTVCEFDCVETECRMGDWTRCTRRLRELEPPQPDENR